MEEIELARIIVKAYEGVKISLGNEIAELCDRLGLNSNSVLSCMWSPQFPGGFGPKISEALEKLLELGRGVGVPMELTEAALGVNWERPYKVCDTVGTVLGDLKGKKIMVSGGMGTARLVRELQACGAEVVDEGGECLIMLKGDIPPRTDVLIVFAQVRDEMD